MVWTSSDNPPLLQIDSQPRLGAIVTSSCEADESQVGFLGVAKEGDILGAEHSFGQKGSLKKRSEV